MSDVNVCTFVGRCTRDAETTTVGSKGTSLTKWAIANNTGFGQYAKASFIAVQLWGQSASALKEYLKKGTKVAVAGEFTQNDWTDQNGVKHSMWRLSASRVTLLGSSNRNTETTVDSSNEEETVF
jgi:single stranded DNA-binding protein